MKALASRRSLLSKFTMSLVVGFSGLDMISSKKSTLTSKLENSQMYPLHETGSYVEFFNVLKFD